MDEFEQFWNMSKLSDYGFKWVKTDLGHYKITHILTLNIDDNTEEIASIVKTDKEKIFLIEAKCEELGFKTEQEFDNPKMANRFVSNTKKWIGEELIKIQDH